MKRQRRLKDIKSGGKRLKMSPETPNTGNGAVSSSSKADAVLPPELLRKICSMLITEQKDFSLSQKYAVPLAREQKKPNQKKKIKRDRERLIERIQVAATNSALRQCVLQQNQQTRKHQLRVSLERDRSAIVIDGKIKCDGDAVEQVKAALNFFYPTELLLTLKKPQMQQAQHLFDALGDIDMNLIKARKMAIESAVDGSCIGQHLSSSLPFVRQLTHVQLKLTAESKRTDEDDISSLFEALGRCSRLQVFDIDCATVFNTNLFDAISRSMPHLTQLPELKAIGLFGSWAFDDNAWEEYQATLFNNIPAALSSLCQARSNIWPDDTSQINRELLLSEAVRANIECVCCIKFYNEFETLQMIVEGILQHAPNCAKVVVESAEDKPTKKEVRRMCSKLLRWLEKTGDRRTKIELVAPDLLDSIDADEDLEFTLGERSIVVSREPKDGIECVFDCFNEL